MIKEYQEVFEDTPVIINTADAQFEIEFRKSKIPSPG